MKPEGVQDTFFRIRPEGSPLLHSFQAAQSMCSCPAPLANLWVEIFITVGWEKGDGEKSRVYDPDSTPQINSTLLLTVLYHASAHKIE